jgi:hypothetical protein
VLEDDVIATVLEFAAVKLVFGRPVIVAFRKLLELLLLPLRHW